MEIKEIIRRLESADSYHTQAQYRLNDEAIFAAIDALNMIESLQDKAEYFRDKSDGLLKENIDLHTELNESMEFQRQYQEVVSQLECAKIALAESRRREQAAVEDMALIVGQTNSALTCNCCKYNSDDNGCELDGSQFDDDGECHFTWRGPQEAGR